MRLSFQLYKLHLTPNGDRNIFRIGISYCLECVRLLWTVFYFLRRRIILFYSCSLENLLLVLGSGTFTFGAQQSQPVFLSLTSGVPPSV